MKIAIFQFTNYYLESKKCRRFSQSVVLLAVLIGFSSCVSQKMTLGEAKQLAVTFEKNTYQPPPRQIDDVLAILDQNISIEPDILRKTKETAEKDCSLLTSNSDRCSCLFKRSVAHYYLGQTTLAQEDIQKGMDLFNKGAKIGASITEAIVLCEIGHIEAENGNFLNGIRLVKIGNDLARRQRTNGRRILADIHSMMGDYITANKLLTKNIHHCDQLINANNGRAYMSFARDIYLAQKLENQGKYSAAEKYRRKGLSNRSFFLSPFHTEKWSVQAFPGKAIELGMDLAENLVKQGKFIEAEQVSRETLKDSIAICGKESAYTGKLVGQLAEIKLAQGNVSDAERLAGAQIRLYENIGLLSSSRLRGEAQALRGDILTARFDFDKAVDAYTESERMFEGNRYYYDKVIVRNPNRILAMIYTGHVGTHLKILPSMYESQKSFFGENNYRTAEVLAFKAMLSSAEGEERQAFAQFSKAMAVLFDEEFDASLGFLTKQRRKIITQSYIELLLKLNTTHQDQVLGVDGLDLAFHMIQKLKKSSVSKASNAAFARSAASYDSDLYDLVRKEQDLDVQFMAIQAGLADAISARENPQRLEIISSRKKELETIQQAKAAMLAEITKRFPKYASFVRPKSIGIRDVQKLLRSRESMLIISSTSKRTYVWAIPGQGEVLFSSTAMGQSELGARISRIRSALTPEAELLGNWPPFDVQAAYGLYRDVLEPVEKVWADKMDLILVTSGPFGQLPISLLPTSMPKMGSETGVLFTNYRKIPWLIRKVSLTLIPSVSSFKATRQEATRKSAEKMFAGFGNPLFNKNHVASVEEVKDNASLVSRGSGLRLRGIRVSNQGDLDNSKISSVDLASLIQLPDTAREIESIAKILDADLSSDVFLGKAASEHVVKSMNLSDRRVVVFASHGLLPGDLDGLYEPAIALSSPLVTGEKEDGLLTMSEVLKLKLNAEWVVLSACNTGAGKGAGAEAMSGLGRAFIYAGSKALLVSMWPVETTSAREITTGLFRYLKDHPHHSRARALQQIMIDLLDNRYIEDPQTGKAIVSYAHPLFWAPFIVFGEGGK